VKTAISSYFLEYPFEDSDSKEIKGLVSAICKNLVDEIGQSSVKFINAREVSEKAFEAGIPVFWALYNELTQAFNELEFARIIIFNFFDSVFSKKYPISPLERIYLLSMLKMLSIVVVLMKKSDWSFVDRLAEIDPVAAKVADFYYVKFDLESEYFVDLVAKLKQYEEDLPAVVSKYYLSILLYVKLGQFLAPVAWKIKQNTNLVGLPDKYSYVNVGIKDLTKAMHDKKFLKKFPEMSTAETIAEAFSHGDIFVAPGTSLAASVFADLPQRKI